MLGAPVPNLGIGDMFAIKLVEYISKLDAKSEKKMVGCLLKQKASGTNARMALTWLLNLKRKMIGCILKQKASGTNAIRMTLTIDLASAIRNLASAMTRVVIGRCGCFHDTIV